MRRRGMRRVGVGLGIAGLLLTGCGGGGSETLTAATSTTPVVVTTVPVTQALATTTSVSGNRQSVPTTTTPPRGDVSIADRSLIPEATASYALEPLRINGQNYANALEIQSRSTPQKVEIDAARVRKRFLGTLGVPDNQKSSASSYVEISVDKGPALYSTQVSFGETKEVDVDVTGALRVVITVSARGIQDYNHAVAIGNPRFSS